MSMQPEQTSQGRNMRVVQRPVLGRNVNRWAIIVGISQYKDARLNLKYAHRDAEELYQLIQAPSGGGFAAERIVKLVDAEATTANVINALRTFLTRPVEEDIVLIYFACHGGPDPRRPKVMYLLTYDTDFDNISATSLRMSEIELSLRDYLQARRVVIIADTCHSACIGGGMRDTAANVAEITNRYLDEVSKTREGVALLTSATAHEVSQENEQWGGGHGVFTYFLLQGMRGEADGYNQPKDGIVTVGELFEYVRDSVKKATNNQQHPTIGTTPYDPNLPMAVTGGIHAQEYYLLGRCLYDLGWLLDDAGRWADACQNFQEAIRLSELGGTSLPEAELWQAKALFATGDYLQARALFQTLIQRDIGKLLPEVWFYLGLAHAKQRNYPAAVQALEQFLAQAPYHEDGAWIKEYVSWMKKVGGVKYALLIGIDEYAHFPKLGGCANDVGLMKEVLTHKCDFAEKNVRTLLNAEATCANIWQALTDLSHQATPADTIFVHYSGHSGSAQLLAYDAMPQQEAGTPAQQEAGATSKQELDRPPRIEKAISIRKLHEHMKSMPALHKVLILDTHVGQLRDLQEQVRDYAFLAACGEEDRSYEHTFDLAGKPVSAGLFTGVLSQYLSQADLETLTYGQLIDAIISNIHKLGYEQMPVFLGDREWLFFRGPDIYRESWEFAQQKVYPAISKIELAERYARFRQTVNVPFAQVHCSFGRAFLEKENYSAAIEALLLALGQRNDDYETALLLGKAQLGVDRYVEALASFRRYLDLSRDTEAAVFMPKLIDSAEQAAHGQKYALLVGINEYLNPGIPRKKGAVHNALAMKEVLMTKLGFQAENITVLTDHEATREAILNGFRNLVEEAQLAPALFYFSGAGSWEEPADELRTSSTRDIQRVLRRKDKRTLISVDGRQPQIWDISLQQLSALAVSETSNLVTILDLIEEIPLDNRNIRYTRGFAPRRKVKNCILCGGEMVTEDLFTCRTCARPGICRTHCYDPKRDQCIQCSAGESTFFEAGLAQKIGAVAIYSRASPASSTESEFPALEGGGTTKVYGKLTHALLQSILKAEPGSLSYEEWVSSACSLLEPVLTPVVVNDNPYDVVFSNRTMRAGILAQVNKIVQEPLQEAIAILERVKEQREQKNEPYPEGLLNLGIAYAAKFEYENSMQTYDKSIQALERVVATYNDVTMLERESQRDPRAKVHSTEAHYYLGRILFACKLDLTRAISELRKATEGDPDNIRAYYYLGQAIRLLVERETLAKAEEALRKYLTHGAPLGHKEEVEEFLNSRLWR